MILMKEQECDVDPSPRREAPRQTCQSKLYTVADPRGALGAQAPLRCAAPKEILENNSKKEGGLEEEGGGLEEEGGDQPPFHSDLAPPLAVYSMLISTLLLCL